jgi:spermidine synthase
VASASRTVFTPEVGSPAEHRFLPALLFLFVGSGCAALIYEVVWFQMLQLIVGSSTISLGVVLGTFMGGMCVGSLYLSRFVSRRQHPLRVYSMLEAGIGALGLILLVALPWVGGLYTAIAVHGMAGLFLRAIFCAIALLPPTLLMGATLPAISRWVEATPRGVAWLGFFYGGNTAGAVLGCILAGFFLLSKYDVTTATLVAVAINFAVALAGLALARGEAHATSEDPEAESKEVILVPPGSWPVYVTIALSGMSALGAEVIWTRLLSLLIGATTYTFSLILAAFLTGLGIGSSIGSFAARTVANPRAVLGWCQFLIMGGLAWAAYCLARGLPYWPINPELSTGAGYTFQIDIVRCLWTVLPSAVLWGASFPLALAAIANRDQDPGKLVGGVYAANTVGAIVGSIITSLWLVSWLGTQNAQRVLIVIAAAGAIMALVPVVRQSGKLSVDTRGLIRAFATIIVAVLLAASVGKIPGLLVAYGRWMPLRMSNMNDVIYMGEGRMSTIAITRLPNGVLNYHNAGKVQASSEPQDMRLQRMLGHLTTLLPPNPKRVLVIGCGAGVTAGAVSIDPRVEHETIAEIEKLVPYAAGEYFGEHNFNVVKNPKVHIEIDDARHYILTTNEKFDAITSDPLDPWVKGAANLYTREFWELAKKHLNPGGVVTVFVQLYESNEAAVKSEVATFFEAFPNAIVFGNTYNGAGYDMVLVGQRDPGPINIDQIEQRLQSPEYAPVAFSLSQVGFNSAQDLFATFAGQGAQLRPWLADAQINRDRNLRLQYLAGLGFNLYQQASIYEHMIQYKRWPEGLFTGSPEKVAALKNSVGGF